MAPTILYKYLPPSRLPSLARRELRFTKEQARQSLAEAIELILEVRREEALRGVPDDAERETVTLE